MQSCKVDLFEDNFNDEVFDQIPGEKQQRKDMGWYAVNLYYMILQNLSNYKDYSQKSHLKKAYAACLFT